MPGCDKALVSGYIRVQTGPDACISERILYVHVDFYMLASPFIGHNSTLRNSAPQKINASVKTNEYSSCKVTPMQAVRSDAESVRCCCTQCD
eukprot:904830-Pleurochrysis_carterae.AAC.1